MQRPVAAVKENEAPAEVENAVQAPAVAETAAAPAVVEASPVAEAHVLPVVHLPDPCQFPWHFL